jgi:hypothetical protein
MLSTRLARHFAFAAVATTVSTATVASADIVHWGDANLVIPATYAGLYINVETRETGDSEDLAGWDMNPYGSGALLWYCPVGVGVLRAGELSGVSSLPSGYLVDASGLFEEEPSTEFGDQEFNWALNASNYFGFSYIAADGEIHYGWARMDVGATALVRTIAEIAYNDVAGAGIAVGAVPAPGVLALVGLAGLVRRRSR